MGLTANHHFYRAALLITFLAGGAACTSSRNLAGTDARAKQAGGDRGPQSALILAEQGSFFVGGRSVHSSAPATSAFAAWLTEGDITVDQMYVQYTVPQNAAHRPPVVMLHGGVLSGKTYETTPDGRMGWDEYFVRRGYPVYVPDQVARARSGFDLTVFNRVKRGELSEDHLPEAFMASHELSWTLFRFGPRFNEAFPDTRFPVQAATELYKQVIPDVNGLLAREDNPTWHNLSRLAIQLKGAILMGHSESGFYPERAALIDPTDIRGLITLEPSTCSTLSPSEYAQLARIPTLVVFGDHLDDVPEPIRTFYTSALHDCQNFIREVNAAGGKASLLHLPAVGLHGNSHMMMQDTNNLDVADLILDWIEQHIESH